MLVQPAKLTKVEQLVGKIVANRARYESVEQAVYVPWYVIGVIHYREATLSFEHHLYNGDPLTARTVHVPIGRPVTGEPPFTWEESAIDALRYEGLDRVTDWSVPAMLDHLERYNGLGYRSHHINTPYLWSFTNQYSKGKYVADHGFDINAVDQQCGCAPLLQKLL